MRRKEAFLAVGAVVAVHALLWWVFYWPAPKWPWGDETLYLRAAGEMLDAGRLKLDPLWPALYPRFVAGCLAIGGGSLVPLQLVQTMLLLLSAMLMRELALRWTGRQDLSAAVALFLAGYPPLVAFAQYVWPEVLHLALFLIALWILEFRRDDRRWLAGLGFVLGLALLSKNLLVPFLPILLVPLVRFGSRRIRLARLGIVVTVLGLTVAPILVAGGRQHGTWGTSASGRFNLWVGLNERSRVEFVDEIVGLEYAAYLESAESPRSRHEALGREIGGLIRERGVTALFRAQLSRQYFRLFSRESFLTEQLTGGVLWGPDRGYRNRSPTAAALIRALSYSLYTLLILTASVGAAFLGPDCRRRAAVLLWFLVYNLALFLVLHVKTRYRVQILPSLLILAACGGANLIRLGSAGPWRSLASRGLLALALVSVALALVFAGGFLD